jgi:hypothetical protein
LPACGVRPSSRELRPISLTRITDKSLRTSIPPSENSVVNPTRATTSANRNATGSPFCCMKASLSLDEHNASWSRVMMPTFNSEILLFLTCRLGMNRRQTHPGEPHLKIASRTAKTKYCRPSDDYPKMIVDALWNADIAAVSEKPLAVAQETGR